MKDYKINVMKPNFNYFGIFNDNAYVINKTAV